MRRFVFFNLLTLFSVFVFLGCASQTRSRELPGFAVERMQRGSSVYTRDVPPEQGGDEHALARKFLGGLDQENRTRFRHDPRLDAMASAYAHTFAKKETRLARGLMRWMMWNQGIGAALDDVDLTWASGRRVHHRLDVDLRKYAFNFEGDGGRYTFGVARVRTGPIRWGQAIVVAQEPIILADIRKEYQPGEELLIRGRIVEEYDYSVLSMSLGDLSDVTLPLSPDENGKFIVKLPVPSQPGEYRIEVNLYRRPGRWSTAFFAPIYVGRSQPVEPKPEVVNPRPNPAALSKWSGVLVAKYNEARAARGLPPLQMSREASQLASVHAREMAKTPYTPMPYFSRLLEEGGIDVGGASWSRGRLENLDEEIRENLLSPWMRSELFDEDVTHIGLAFAPIESDKRRRYAMVQILFGEKDDSARGMVEEFIKRVGQKDTPDPKTQSLVEQLAKKMSRLANVEVEHDSRLDPLAWYQLQNSGIEGRLAGPLQWKTGVWGSRFMRSYRRAEDGKLDPYAVLQFAARVALKEENQTARYKIGFSRRPTRGGREIQSLFVVRQALDLEPLKRSYTPGEEIVLEGRFLGTPHYPHVFIDRGGADVFEQDVEVDKAGRFRLRLPAATEPGRYFVQLKTYPVDYNPDELRLYYDGRSVVLWPIHVGIEPPHGVDERLLTPRENPEDRAAWADYVLDLYNKERKAHGLRPLIRNELTEVLAKSKLERDERDISSPSFSKIDERLEHNRIASVVSWGYRDADHIFATMARDMMRPTFKSVLLDPETTMVSIALEDEANWFSMILLRQFDTGTNKEKPRNRQALAVEAAQRSWSAAKLSGEDSRKIDETLETALDGVKECYEEELRYYDDLEGSVSVRYVIGVDGDVIATLVDDASPRNTDLENCIVEVVDKLEFPRSFTGRVTPAEVTFELKPKVKFEAGRKSIVGRVHMKRPNE